jgi:hypothetical protein
VGLTNDLRHNEAGFSTISTDSLCLRVAQMPRYRDLAIFVLTIDGQTYTDTQTGSFTPAAHPRTRGTRGNDKHD